MNKLETSSNPLYLEFKRYEHEIFIDVYDKILSSTVVIAKNTLLELKEKEMRYLVQYHQKTLLNALFFKDEKIFIEYHKWLYRVYYYRKIDLDFFKYLNQLFEKITSHYIDQKKFFSLGKYFENTLLQHTQFIQEAPNKRLLIEYDADVKELVKALLAGDKERCSTLLQERVTTLEEFVHFFDTTVHNAMIKIGYMWEAGEISVAKEHLASGTLYDVLVVFLDRFKAVQTKKLELFISSAPNEHHGLGIKIASIVLEKLGYQVTSLGIDLPSKEIFKAITEFKPDIFLLVATLPANALDVALLIEELQQSKQFAGKEFQIGIAGNAFEKIFQPAKVLKADFYVKNLQSLLQTLQ